MLCAVPVQKMYITIPSPITYVLYVLCTYLYVVRRCTTRNPARIFTHFSYGNTRIDLRIIHYTYSCMVMYS